MLWKCCTQYASKFGTQHWPQDGKRSVFISIPKKVNDEKYSNYDTIALISHASKVILIILQARLQQCVNQELPDVQAGFRKNRGTRDQIANIHCKRVPKKIYICFIDYAKAFDCVDHNKLQKIIQEMDIKDHFTCLLRNLYADQEATWNNWLAQNWERTVTRMYIVTLLI